MELILSLKSETVKSVKSLVSVSNSYYRYLLAEWIHRVDENTSDIRVGTMSDCLLQTSCPPDFT